MIANFSTGFEGHIEPIMVPIPPHGFVNYVDHMGSDLAIVAAARQSNGAEASKGTEKDAKLLRYLMVNHHTSPFEMAKIKFEIQMPVFVARQFVRHRMQNLNEVSARYTQLPDLFFRPSVWRTNEGTKNLQASVPAPHINKELADELAEDAYGTAWSSYQKLLEMGVARELARIVLPVGIYTKVISCWDMNNFLKFLTLRDDDHAQHEIREIAVAMKEIAKEFFPATIALFEELRNAKR